MHLGLDDRVAIVTGASRGIGRAIAQALAAEGMRLALVARSADLLAEVATTLPTETLTCAVDLRETSAPADVVQRTVEHFGQLDLLVNNAGATVRGDFLDLTEAQWADGYALKLLATVRASRAAWPHLVASSGAIVNVVGISGRTGSGEFTIGGTVTAALLNLTKALADRGVTYCVRVNAVNPGSIATGRLTAHIAAHGADKGISEEQARHEMAGSARVAQFSEPVEIARAVAFLASAGYMQGAVLDVEGGATRTL